MMKIGEYYNELNTHLSQFGLRLGKNLTNPDIGYVNPKQVGIYDKDIQIGKIERTIKKNTLILQNVKMYKSTNTKKYDIINKLYPFEEKFARANQMNVMMTGVNPYTYKKFEEYFKDWYLSKKGDTISATKELMFDEGVKEIMMSLFSLGAMAYEADYVMKQLNKRPEPVEQKIEALSQAKKVKPNVTFDQAYNKLMSYYDKDGQQPQKLNPTPFVDNDLLSFIKKHETYIPKKYWDYKQYSIGYGTKASPNDTKISEQEAARRLAKVVAEHKKKVVEASKKWGYNWNKKQIDALTSFRFNIGNIGELTKNGTRDNNTIAKKMLEYVGAGGEVAGGLVNRRKAEQQLFLGKI